MDKILNLSVTGNKIKATNSINITSHSENWFKCAFTFDSTWTGLSKIAVFTNNKKTYISQALATDDTCYIPLEVLQSAGYLFIGVIHADTEEIIPSEWTFVTIREGVDTGEAPEPPSQSVYITLLEGMQEALALATEVNNAANDGDYTSTVELGTVTTGEPGTDVIITNTGTAQNAVLNFTIPGGISGEGGTQGVQGTKGDKGDKGDPGSPLEFLWGSVLTQYQLGVRVAGTETYTYSESLKGEKGDQGIQGIQGIQGEQGIQGIQGARGLTGSTGATGAQGPTGATGAKGDKGDKGSTGDTGAQGPQGEQGIQGPAGANGEQAVSVSATLATASWVGDVAPYTQAVAISGMTSSKNGNVGLSSSATAEQRTAARDAQLSLTSQGTDTITITADGTKPAVDISIAVILLW